MTEMLKIKRNIKHDFESRRGSGYRVVVSMRPSVHSSTHLTAWAEGKGELASWTAEGNRTVCTSP